MKKEINISSCYEARQADEHLLLYLQIHANHHALFSGAFTYDKLHAAVEGATPSDVMV